MIWINADDAIAIHGQIIKKSGGSDGLRDRAGLEAAIAAPLQTFGNVDFYPTVIEKIARLGYGLASNHAFVDGNKRIGALMTQLLLKWNGYRLDKKQPQPTKMDCGCDFLSYSCLIKGKRRHDIVELLDARCF